MASSNEKESDNDLVISYLTLRKAVGYLGVALPFILIAGSFFVGDCTEIQSSISNFYHTRMGDVFVGILCFISVFLFVYKGYDRKDSIAGNIAGTLGTIVALFPTTLKRDIDGNVITCNIERSILNPDWVGIVHLVAAASFFIVLAYFSIFLFTKSNPAIPPTPRKLQRNTVYRICGYIILTCIALLLVFFLLPLETRGKLNTFKPVFWLETIALLSFGVSWLTKGEALLPDKK